MVVILDSVHSACTVCAVHKPTILWQTIVQMHAQKKPTTLVSRRKKSFNDIKFFISLKLLFNDIKALYINRSLDFCRY